MKKLESLTAAYPRECVDGVREELLCTSIDFLRKVHAAAGLPLRAGGKLLPASDSRPALLSHVASASGADGQEQAGNLHDLDCYPLCKERIYAWRLVPW